MVGACSPSGRPTDILAGRDAVLEARVAGREGDKALDHWGDPVRMNDLLYRTLPAGPPSRLRFAVDLPKEARLRFRCAIGEAFLDRPGVEFVVKVLRRGREETVFSRLLDPLKTPADRGFVAAEADLSKYAGRTELILETRGYEETGEAKRAFWGVPAVTAPLRKAPLVVVYLVDTLRADHTGTYGYARETTPALDAFAQEAVVFDNAIASASWTKPSVASLLTSLPPGQHRAVQLRDRLDDSLVTLAEMLRAKGYSTGAAIANSVIYLPEAHFDQGFDYFEGLHGEDDRPSKIVEAAPVVDRALAWVEARAGLPTFLYVHTMDPHVPYTPPPPFDRRYEPPPADGHPGQDPRTDYKEPLDRDRLMAQYDGEIAYGDREFGRFVAGLKSLGVYDDALLVFLADHGEEFLDHGKWLHGRSVFDELVRVPLLVKLPGGRDAGRRVAQQVQLVDVLPTVLESQGLPVPAAPAVTGRPLQTVLRGGAVETPALSEISHRGIVAHGLRTNRDKYIRRFSPETDELYFDLTRDPREQRSILGSSPERERYLRAGVEASYVANPFRYVVKAAGAGEYRLSLTTSGSFASPQGEGLGPGETYELVDAGRRLEALLRPRPDAPRELSFNLRPRGAPVRLEGKRDARPLRPADIALGPGRALHPPAARSGERERAAKRPLRRRRGAPGPLRVAGAGPGPRGPAHGQGDVRADEGPWLRRLLRGLLARTIHEVRRIVLVNGPISLCLKLNPIARRGRAVFTRSAPSRSSAESSKDPSTAHQNGSFTRMIARPRE
jgi:arylsulfatase A-like enzyme